MICSFCGANTPHDYTPISFSCCRYSKLSIRLLPLAYAHFLTLAHSAIFTYTHNTRLYPYLIQMLQMFEKLSFHIFTPSGVCYLHNMHTRSLIHLNLIISIHARAFHKYAYLKMTYKESFVSLFFCLGFCEYTSHVNNIHLIQRHPLKSIHSIHCRHQHWQPLERC